jgi:pantoate--beta-alanine ligase
MKLLNIVKANVAYFGEKDFQQYLLIKGMAEAFFIDTEIVSVKTEREKDGLALSSRNIRLSGAERDKATIFPKQLSSNKSCSQIESELIENGFKVDYIKEFDGRRFGAVHVGSVRLIDNVKI